MANLAPYDILILDPDVQDVSDAFLASPASEIVCRFWDLDDGRSDANSRGVYGRLADDPVGTAKWYARHTVTRLDGMVAEAQRRGLPFPEKSQLVAHLINEPDTNNLMAQINTFTAEAVPLIAAAGYGVEAFCLGTGHPAQLNAEGKPDWAPLTEALAVCYEHKAYAVVHEYYNDLGIEDPSVNPWHIFRHRWAPQGHASPRMKIGEFGLEMLLNGRRPDHHGWRGIISGDQYLADHRYYLSNVREDVVSVRTF